MKKLMAIIFSAVIIGTVNPMKVEAETTEDIKFEIVTSISEVVKLVKQGDTWIIFECRGETPEGYYNVWITPFHSTYGPMGYVECRNLEGL